MPTLVETRADHRDRVTRGLSELARFRARRDALMAVIDWHAMTEADRERAEDVDLQLAICGHELGLEMAAIERGIF